MKKKSLLSLLVGVLISVVAFYFSFRHIPLRQLWSYVLTINYLWMLPSALTLLISFAVRARRWRNIIAPLHPLTFWEAYHPLMIGFALNLIMPGRLGEVARPAILKKQKQVPFSTGLVSVALERLFDLVFLLLLFVIFQATVEVDPHLSMQFGGQTLNRATLESIGHGMFVLCVVAIGAILFLCYHRTRRACLNLILKLPLLLFPRNEAMQQRLTEKACLPVVRVIENMVGGFAMLKDLRNVLSCWLDTCVVWVLVALSYYLMALGSPGIDLNFFEIGMVMVIIGFFITLPSVPGYWGLWEAGGIFALSLFGIAAENAAGYTLVNHGLQVVPTLIAGIVSSAVTGVKLTGGQETDEA